MTQLEYINLYWNIVTKLFLIDQSSPSSGIGIEGIFSKKRKNTIRTRILYLKLPLSPLYRFHYLGMIDRSKIALSQYSNKD